MDWLCSPPAVMPHKMPKTAMAANDRANCQKTIESRPLMNVKIASVFSVPALSARKPEESRPMKLPAAMREMTAEL